MIVEPARVAALAHSFNDGLASAALSPQSRPLAEIEGELAMRVAELARACGWTREVRTQLAEIDLERVREFPPANHRHGCIVRVPAEGSAEVVLNRSALEIANFRALMSRLPAHMWLVGKALERDPRFSGEIPCFLGDVSYWPNVACSGNHPDALLIPDSDFFGTRAYEAFKEATASGLPRWEDRIAKVFWRGSTSGVKRYWPPESPEDVRWLPRLELCARAQEPPLAAVCDVGFTNLVQIPERWTAEVAGATARLKRPAAEKSAFAQFRAVIDIDGNSNAWSGLFTSLLTGACVIKVASELGFSQWYYDRLEPWVHYVPVKADFSDLEPAIRLVLSDERTARRIGAAGSALARSLDLDREALAAADRLVAWAARR
ncbi:MAG TPA: glycosyl transferase family 90 [Candidatus Elarobacter sp.]